MPRVAKQRRLKRQQRLARRWPRYARPKHEWGEGPWQGEPDRIEWRHASGYPLLMTRNHHGAWCGYVGVPPGHPWHGKRPEETGADAHGGLNYAEPCHGRVCHTPKRGEPHDIWWLGFDCSHAFRDRVPGLDAVLRHVRATTRPLDELFTSTLTDFGGVYRDVTYVRAECESLGDQAFNAAAV